MWANLVLRLGALVLLFAAAGNAFGFGSMYMHSRSRQSDRSRQSARQSESGSRKSSALEAVKAVMLPEPSPNAVGNFFDNQTDSMSFIQCHMLAMATIEDSSISGSGSSNSGSGFKSRSKSGSKSGSKNSNSDSGPDTDSDSDSNGGFNSGSGFNSEVPQYGVGFPIDMPVMLTYFEDSELKPVRPDYADYDHLLNHVAVQMDGNEFQLYRTPIVLTLQGEFEDEEFNQVHPFDIKEEDEEEYDDEEEEEEWEEEEEEEELTLEQLLAQDDLLDSQEDEDEDGEDGEDGEEGEDGDDEGDGNSNMSSFWSTSPAGKVSAEYQSKPDFTLVRPENPDVSDIPDDAFVTPEDTQSLRRAHRRADRIMDYAADVKLIASFHYKKKNFHLVRLLEPIFVIGKRMDLKGYFFTLLDDAEAERVRPLLEQMLVTTRQQRALRAGGDVTDVPDAGRGRGFSGRDETGSVGRGVKDVAEVADATDAGRGVTGVSAGEAPRRTRRRWTERKKQD